MTTKLGIFMNITDSDIKYHVNRNNYNNLNKNFTKTISFDIDSVHSKDFEYIKYKNDISFNEKILFILENISYELFDNITFISDEYIYCDDLESYFNYIDKHNLDFSSYTDSSEIEYHYQSYLFTIKTSCINTMIKFLKENISNKLFGNSFLSIFDNKIPNKIPNKISYMKIAHLESNLNTNIFFDNDEVYEFLLDNNLLPIINITRLIIARDNYTFKIHENIPDDFDIDIYRTHEDLKHYDTNFLHKHFIEYGQFEHRLYKKDNSNPNIWVLPHYIRKKLSCDKCNLLYLFDIPDDFIIRIYIENNKDLANFSIEKLIKHWLHYGKYENRTYK